MSNNMSRSALLLAATLAALAASASAGAAAVGVEEAPVAARYGQLQC